MKFQFEGYEYEDDKDYIEIDFDFMGKSEFISVLEPDLMVPIMIPEKFSNFQIDEFKGILEKINRKEELTDEDKYLCNSKVLKPLFEYFKIEKKEIEIKNNWVIGSVDICNLGCSEDGKSWDVYISIKTENYVGSFFSTIYKTEPDDKCSRYYIGDNGGYTCIYEEGLMSFRNKAYKNKSGRLKLFTSDEIIEFCYNNGCLFVSFENPDISMNTIEINNPIEFLDSFHEKIKNLLELKEDLETSDESEEDESEEDESEEEEDEDT